MYPTLFKFEFLPRPITSYGFMMMLGFLAAIFWAARRAGKDRANPDIILNLGFVALIFGVFGARLFYFVHYYQRSFAHRPFWSLFYVWEGGLEFYGGMLCALVAVAVYLRIKQASIRWYLDIIAPSLMVGLAFGRIGCFLNGCCWGKPTDLAWAVRFPYGSLPFTSQWHQGQVTVPEELIYVERATGAPRLLNRDLVFDRVSHEELVKDRQRAEPRRNDKGEVIRPPRPRLLADIDMQCIGYGLKSVTQLRDLARQYRSVPIHPVQLYGSLNALLIAGLLLIFFHWRRRHGTVFGMLLVIYAISRFCLEMLRADNPYDQWGGLTISQMTAIYTFMVGVAWLVLMRLLPLRSPRAVAFVPPPEPSQDTKKD